jgi:putative mRNA 3-end processing factor
MILVSRATKDLLAATQPDIPLRNNVTTLDPGQQFMINGDAVELVPSNHMLGGVQVKLTCRDGYRIGYSSDFFWPLDKAIEVDALLIDSTYGNPLRARRYKQQLADDQLLKLASSFRQRNAPFAVLGYNGRLQYALSFLSSVLTCPVICSPKAFPYVSVYAQYGYQLPEVLDSTSDEAISLRRSNKMHVYFATLHERRHLPALDRIPKITLSAHLTTPDDPVMQYDNGDCCVALTDHADFAGTIEYVRATGAKTVWTDPRTGDAEALATAIRDQLGLESAISETIDDLSW